MGLGSGGFDSLDKVKSAGATDEVPLECEVE